MDNREQIKKYSIISTNVSSINYEQSSNLITENARFRNPYKVTALAVHGLMESFFSRNLNYSLNKFDLVLPDGQPLKWILNLFYKQNLIDRVSGPDLTNRLINFSEKNNFKILFYGSKDSTLKKIKSNLKKSNPQLTKVDFIASKFKKVTQEEQKKIALEIESLKPNIVFVGLGCPRQEYWVTENSKYINCPVISVGAAFDYLAGNLKRAPKIMQKLGLEWFFRFIQEPRRLFYRYIILNSYFLTLATLQCFSKNIFINKKNLNQKDLKFTGWS